MPNPTSQPEAGRRYLLTYSLVLAHLQATLTCLRRLDALRVFALLLLLLLLLLLRGDSIRLLLRACVC